MQNHIPRARSASYDPIAAIRLWARFNLFAADPFFGPLRAYISSGAFAFDGRRKRALTRGTSMKAIFYAFDQWIEHIALLYRIDHCKAVDQPPGAAEDHLLVEDLAIAFAR